MSVAIGEFWNMAVESRLLSPTDCQQWDGAFAHVKGAASQGNAATLGEWLVANGVLSRYQAQTLLAGRPGPFVFGEYCVYDRIRSREGRLAGLFRAMHMGTRHPVLLYFMPPETAESAEAWSAAVNQVAWACWVGHPFVVECHQLVDLGEFKIAVLENLAGETVAARLTSAARFSPQDACRIAYQAVLGVARLHQLGIVHGEISPDNLWLTSDGSLKLLQVPLAPQPLHGPAPLNWSQPTASLQVAAEYAAPELAQEGRPPDALTDIYAIGATLFHMLKGAPPFAGGDLASKMARHAAEPVASLAPLGIAPQLDQMIAYLMAKDPNQRYQQAAQVAESLAYFVDPAVVNSFPVLAPTLPAYDQWLQQQERVPGMAAGSIPTALQMAAYTAAQGAAAQQAAQQMPAAPQQFSLDNGYAEQPRGTAFDDPLSGTGSQYESFAAPTSDPLAFMATEPSRPQLDFSALDLSSGGSNGATDDMFQNLGGPAPPPPRSNSSAPPAMDFAEPAAAPALNDLDAVLDTAPRPARKRPTAASSPVAAGKPAAKSNNNLVIVSVLGGSLAVALIVVLVIVMNMGGTRDPSDRRVAETNPPTNSVPGGTALPGGGVGYKTPGAAPSGPAATTTGTPPAGSGTGGPPTAKPEIKPPNPKGNGNPPPKNEPGSAIADDGSSFWASPTSGSPLSTSYFASGAQVVLALRPANIVRRADGDQVLPALGPWGPSGEQLLKTLTGMELAQIDQVIAVWHDLGNGQLTPTLIVRTQEKMATDALLPAWGNPSAAKEGDEPYYQGQSWCYYVPTKEQGKVLVVGKAAQIKEVIQSAGEAPAMSGHLERMLKDTDSDRDVTIAFIPGPLFKDNQAFFVGELAALRKPAETFFGDDVKAGMVSLHFNGNFFVEMRILGTADKTADTITSQFANRARSLPDMVENALVDLNLHRYGKKLLLRFPEQLRLLAENTRSDVDDDMAVLRCYLPGVATNNLLLATELALAEQPLNGAPAGGGEKTLSIAELLQKKTTLTFPRDTLEKSLQMLLDDVGVKYEILGGDLQLEGITKNQSFGLDEKDKTAGEILRKIMSLANVDGKLVYVIKPKQPGGPEMLFITTRASATKRGDKLPPELAAAPSTPPPKKKP